MTKVLDYEAQDYSGEDDDRGFFWEEAPKVSRGKGNAAATIDNLRRKLANRLWPPFVAPPPLTAPPSGFVAIDFETDDPTLFTKGPAWAFEGVGKILGVGVAWAGFDAYYPMWHREGNVDDPENVMQWLSDLFDREDVIVVCANTPYDIGWAYRYLGKYPKRCADVQQMAMLLDEYSFSYSLENIGQRYLRSGKLEFELAEIADEYSVKIGDIKAVLEFIPGHVVAKYGAGDARLTHDLAIFFQPKLEAEGLMQVYELESALLPMTTDMRRKGVKLDVDGAEKLSVDLEKRIERQMADLRALTGVTVNCWEAESCAEALRTDGIVCGTTRTGKPEVQALKLEQDSKTSPVSKGILELRKTSKIKTTFIDGNFLGHVHNGRIHAQFNQLRSEREEGGGIGTVSGRYSCSDPNLQHLPARDPEWGPVTRGLILPDTDLFASMDYKAQEPRLAVHFAFKAKVLGAVAAVNQYRNDPNTDYHQFVAELCGIPRKYAKNLNLGLGYGMGGAKLARALGLPTKWMVIPKGRGKWIECNINEIREYRAQGYAVVECAGDEAREIIRKWEEGAPFIRGLFDKTEAVAKERGYILTILKRRCRFKLINGEYSFTHAAMNRLCQGSAADQTKLGMLHLWQAGVTPNITLHDELLFSVMNEAEGRELSEYMVAALDLEVPTLVDVHCGPTWGAIAK